MTHHVEVVGAHGVEHPAMHLAQRRNDAVVDGGNHLEAQRRVEEPVRNLAPATDSVNPVPPAVADGGLKLEARGTRLLMVKVCALDVPPPGLGLTTVTLALPAVAISASLMSALS